MRTKRKILFPILLAACSLLFVFGNLPSQESAAEIFEKALYYEDVQGDLQKAIELYEQVMKQFPENREIAAKAQLHIGLCYEKLGLQEAPKAFQKVLDDFPEQEEAVEKAKEKLAILMRAQAVVEKGIEDFTIRKIWADPYADINGEVSPDGRYLSYVDWDNGDIALRNLVTGENSRLSNKGTWFESADCGQYSIWSPDSKSIAYSWYYEKDNITDLRICGLDDSKHRVLYNKSEFIQPFDWSPDGKYILSCFTGEDKISHLGLVSIQDGSAHIVKTLGMLNPGNAAFSPDGTHFAFDLPVEKDSYHRDIYILSTDGKREITLIKHPAEDALLSWTPDGKDILFVSNRTGTFDVWTVKASNEVPQGEPELVRKDVGQIRSMGFTMNGSLFFGLSTSMQDVYVAALDIDNGKLLNPPTKASERFIGSNRSPDFSPDGKHLAYVSKRLKGPDHPGSSVLCIKDLESGEEKDFTYEMESFGWFLRWAPDGLSVFVTGIDRKDNKGLYKIDVQTGYIILVFQKGTDIIDFVLSPDGKVVFYRGWDEKKKMNTICRYNLITNQEDEIYRTDGIVNLMISPDGKFLAFKYASYDSPFESLKVLPLEGGELRELLRLEQYEGIVFQSCAWAPDGRYILYGTGAFSMEKPQVELWRISVEGGEPQKLGLSMDWMRHVRIHPDGKHVTFSAGTYTAEVWVMENFLPKEK